MTPFRTASRMRSIARRIMSSSAPSSSAVASELRRVLAAIGSSGRPVTVKDAASGITWEIANPSDHEWTRGLWAFSFGATGTAHVLVWANSADDGLEEAADYLEETGKPGYFMPEDVLRQLHEEARVELGPDAEEDAVSEKAESGLTYTEAGWIPSDEWTVDEASPELVSLAKAASQTEPG